MVGKAKTFKTNMLLYLLVKISISTSILQPNSTSHGASAGIAQWLPGWGGNKSISLIELKVVF